MTEDRRDPLPRRPWQPLAWVLALLSVLAVSWLMFRPGASDIASLNQARRLRAERKYAFAEQAAKAALKANPKLGEAAWLATESAALQGEFARAVECAGNVPDDVPRWKIRASLLAADINFSQLYHLEAAESDYRSVIALDPDNIEANAGLAKLLGLCGRRRDAIPYILRQISLQHPTDQVMLLAREDGVVNDRTTLERARAAFSQDANVLMGLAWIESEGGRFDRAGALLRSINGEHVQNWPAYEALGETLLTTERFPELVEWLKQYPLDASVTKVYVVRGRLAERSGDTQGAIRCYWEALKLTPESKATCTRLSRLLAATGDTKSSAKLAEYVRQMQELQSAQDRALFSNPDGHVEPLLELTQKYESLGRLWEAYGWCLLAANNQPADTTIRRRLTELQSKVAGLPLRMTVDKSNPALSMDLTHLPLPAQPATTTAAPEEGTDTTESQLALTEMASNVGLRFRYFNGTEGPPTRRMFEFTGGGIGIIDFDLDGWSDVLFTQGRRWPPGSADDTHADRLFRNNGQRFSDVTDHAGLQESGFGQGVTVGDYNSDGFPDLYVANIGANVLWRNNGDGTFTDVTAEAGIAGDEWTTSCVLADLSGDGLPDIYDVNYVMGADVYDRICQHQDGSPKICMPFDFEGQPDRLWLNDGAGGFTDATAQALSEPPVGKGLGVAVWDPDGQGRLSLLVANDTTPDFFFEPDHPAGQSFRMSDQALTAGLAVNGEGKATASMGIALGDVNDDGDIDVHITNFYGESNSLFVSSVPGSFEDRSREWGLYATTLDLLGFGTQFLDVDLDGRLELFVTNGHIDDWRAQGRPYEMPPLLLRRKGRQLQKVDPAQVGTYFTSQWLGRAAARIDWNRDGREDLIVGHLGTDSALLTNTTTTKNGFLSLRFVGVVSNRDAIGTTVRARIGQRSVTRQLTAGDGYQASNERRIVIGTGQAAHIEELEVRWPSGTVQKFAKVPANQDLAD